MSGLGEVRQRIVAAETAAGRDPGSVTLVAVSKYHPLSAVRAVAAQGQREFGESREQDLRERVEAEPGLHWHFVGRLQRNKARSVGALAAMVHSCDRAALVGPLARGAADRAAPLPVLVQVSLDGDPARGGAAAADLDALADLVATQGSLTLAGLMAVAVPDAPAGPQFARLAGLAEALRGRHPGASVLSAGMSGDLEAAVAAGATLVRVGTAVFGPPAGSGTPTSDAAAADGAGSDPAG